jgi:hypothetical protein
MARTSRRGLEGHAGHARRKLPVAGAPVWVRLGPGFALGYRRNEAAGTWSLRVTGNGGHWIKRIALADDFEPARRFSLFS